MINEVLSFAFRQCYSESVVGHLLCPECVKDKVTLEAAKIGRDLAHLNVPLGFSKTQQSFKKKFLYNLIKITKIILKDSKWCFKENIMNVAPANLSKDITLNWTLSYILRGQKTMETHAMKLLPHSFCPDVNAFRRFGALQSSSQQSAGKFYALCNSAPVTVDL